MKRFLLLTALLSPIAVAACGQGDGKAASAASTVTVTDAICRPTPNGRQMTGCYLTLKASADDRLLSIASPAASRVEIHESKIESGMMMMTELRDGVALPAGQTVELKPGGNHVMLLGVADPLTTGETVSLTLTFATAAPVEVVAAVAQPAAGGEAHAAGH